MSGSQPCKHAWLVGREVVVSASVRRRVFLGLSDLSKSMEVGSLYGLRLKPQFTCTALNSATNPEPSTRVHLNINFRAVHLEWSSTGLFWFLRGRAWAKTGPYLLFAFGFR